MRPDPRRRGGEGPLARFRIKNPWIKRLLFVLAIAPAIGAIVIFALIARSELAHDESRCPYSEAELREITPHKSIREESRLCEPGVEDHRWVLLEDGQEPLELGRRRLASEHWARGYAWTAAERQEEGDDERRVRLEIRNVGLEPRVFREPPADGHLEVRPPDSPPRQRPQAH